MYWLGFSSAERDGLSGGISRRSVHVDRTSIAYTACQRRECDHLFDLVGPAGLMDGSLLF
jgi:hypothetical protein